MYRRKLQGWLKHIDFILLDTLSLSVAFFFALLTRYGISELPNLTHYQSLFFLNVLLSVFLHIVNNSFSNVLRRGYYKEFMQTVSHVLLVEMVIIFQLFSLKESALYSRVAVYLLITYYILISYIVRILWKRIVRKKGYFFSSAALYILTTKDRAAGTVKAIYGNAKGEYEIHGICILDEDCVGEEIEGIPVISGLSDFVPYLCNKWVDEVYVSIPGGFAVPNDLIDQITEMGIVVHVELNDVGSESWQIRQVQKIGNQVVQTISITNISIRQAIAKRMMDIAGGLVGCLITAVLALILGPLIYIQSPGPIFFSQVRVGKNGKKFRMYKFRSMYPDAEQRKQALMEENRISDGLMFKLKADPRIIGCKILPDGSVKKGIGNFIREYSLDEFPQFFNVLKGDLSLVGTRPPTVDEWEKYNLHHRARLSIRPGITGMWQVSGRSKITDFEEVVELDKRYIREWSVGMDLRILLKTVIVVLRRDGSM